MFHKAGLVATDSISICLPWKAFFLNLKELFAGYSNPEWQFCLGLGILHSISPFYRIASEKSISQIGLTLSVTWHIYFTEFKYLYLVPFYIFTIICDGKGSRHWQSVAVNTATSWATCIQSRLLITLRPGAGAGEQDVCKRGSSRIILCCFAASVITPVLTAAQWHLTSLAVHTRRQSNREGFLHHNSSTVVSAQEGMEEDMEPG